MTESMNNLTSPPPNQFWILKIIYDRYLDNKDKIRYTESFKYLEPNMTSRPVSKTKWIPAILMGLLLRDLRLLGTFFSAYCKSLSEDIPHAQSAQTPDKTNNN